MATFRFIALQEILHRQAKHVEYPSNKTSDYFGINVFDRAKMQQHLSKEAFRAVVEANDTGSKINRKIANQVASGMKSWALDRGATHYTHWFQPLNGATAEKHDAFFEPTGIDGGAIENFDGDLLVQQESDASSFPNGGIRNTFEARGYTAWDPASPAFIVDKTLCIPTIFVSYTGEALDYKAPLLKSLNALDKAATQVCNLFNKDVTKVNVTLGLEQEYFLIDDALFYARPDIAQTGRTMMGHAAAKDQQLEDNYFGSIPERVSAYMRDFEIEALKLGIPLKTRHNEVAPNQFECAPVFEEANLAVDHNQLLMDIMKKTARHHNFRVLFHEKPFDSVNGSGKHNNWALVTNTGVNLLSPGKTPKSNLQFLAFLVNTMKAVYNNADLLRASIVSAGNAHRLGANEAPPAIMSVFLGEKLLAIFNDIEKRVSNNQMTPDEKSELKLDIGKIPEILLDNTDRNRTSPFAFTGNRFEFRAVGSQANCASPMIALNTAMACQLAEFEEDVQKLIAKDIKKDEAIFQVIKAYYKDSKKIIFEGNGYSKEWEIEAEKRGLTNIKSVPFALDAFTSEKTIKLFEKTKVLSKIELEARKNIKLDNYTKILQIESRILNDLSINHIVPTAIKYQNILIDNVRGLKEIFDKSEVYEMASLRLQTIKDISEHISEIKILGDEMTNERKIANLLEEKDKAIAYSTKVRAYFSRIRYHIDMLETIVDDNLWPLPKYRELLSIN